MIRRITFIVLLVTAGFVGGLVLTGRMRTAGESEAQPPAPSEAAAPAAAAQAGRAAAQGQSMPDLTGAAQRAIASVPNISSTQIVRERSPFANDPFYRFFMQDEAFGYRQRREQSLGSGVVVSPDGYVLTNNHVVGNARAEVTVLLPDKSEMRATIVGVDEDTDIAVLKVDAKNLPTLPWGDSSKLKVAEWVLAVGNPFGVLSQTVTLGIVSATGRSLEGRLATYEDFIQTDAAINRGNSGGALINARGELVGINTAIFSETGGYQGIGFAVPSNLVRHVMDELIKYGEVRRGTITGIELTPLTTRIRRGAGGAEHERCAHPQDVEPFAGVSGRPPPGGHHRRLRRDGSGRQFAFHPAALRFRNRQHRVAHGLPGGPEADDEGADRSALDAAASERRAERARIVRRAFFPDTAGLSASYTRHSASTPTLIPMRRLQRTGRWAGCGSRYAACSTSGRAGSDRAKSRARGSGCRGRGTAPSCRMRPLPSRRSARGGGASAAPLRPAPARESAPRPANLPLPSPH